MSVNGKKLFIPASAGGVDFFGDGSGVAWYKLQGNLNDESGNYNATAPADGTPAEAYSTSYVRFGTQSFAPTGSGGTGTPAGSFTTSIPTTKRTESFWVYQTARHTDDTVIFSLDIEREGLNGVYLFDAAGSTATGIPNMSTGTWHHLVTSYNGSNQTKIYIDGSLGGTKTRNGGTLNRTNLVTFSQGRDAPRTKLVNVRVFNRAVSASEVTALYQETWA